MVAFKVAGTEVYVILCWVLGDRKPKIKQDSVLGPSISESCRFSQNVQERAA